MSDDLEKRVAEKLGFELQQISGDIYWLRKDGHQITVGNPHPVGLEVVWNALLAADRRIEELEAALREEIECGWCKRGFPIDHEDSGNKYHLDEKGCPARCWSPLAASLLKAEG